MRAYRMFHTDGKQLFALNSGRVFENDAPAICTAVEDYELYAPYWAKDIQRPEPHPVPAKDCRCGYYAMLNPGDVRYFDGFSSVLAEVEAYGIIQEHEQGIRAQFMRVVAFYQPPSHIEQLAETYGCEVKEADPAWTSENTSVRLMNQRSGVTITMRGAPLRITNHSISLSSLSEKESWFRLRDVAWVNAAGGVVCLILGLTLGMYAFAAVGGGLNLLLAIGLTLLFGYMRRQRAKP